MKSCTIVCMKQLNEEDKEFVKDAIENYQEIDYTPTTDRIKALISLYNEYTKSTCKWLQ